MNMFICSSLNNLTSYHILFTSKFTYISNFCISQVKSEPLRNSILNHPKIKSYSLVDSFFNHSSVSRIRNDGPFIFKTCDVCVNRSVNAAVYTCSLKTSFHLVNGKLLVIIVDFLPALKERCVNSNSAPSLSKDI